MILVSFHLKNLPVNHVYDYLGEVLCPASEKVRTQTTNPGRAHDLAGYFYAFIKICIIYEHCSTSLKFNIVEKTT
jgi:hypothetical protein